MPAIEQRVVEMKFDNKNFNNNVHDTIDSLDDLKKSLALNDAAKGLQNLQKAGDNFNLNGMEEAAGRVQSALSQLAVKGLESIQGLSSKVSAELSKMFNQMAIEPITAGWSKYADKTQAIQTIMAATSKQWTDEAERMEKVRSSLGFLTGSPMKHLINFWTWFRILVSLHLLALNYSRPLLRCRVFQPGLRYLVRTSTKPAVRCITYHRPWRLVQ